MRGMNQNLCFLCMLEDTFSFGAAHKIDKKVLSNSRLYTLKEKIESEDIGEKVFHSVKVKRVRCRFIP